MESWEDLAQGCARTHQFDTVHLEAWDDTQLREHQTLWKSDIWALSAQLAKWCGLNMLTDYVFKNWSLKPIFARMYPVYSVLFVLDFICMFVRLMACLFCHFHMVLLGNLFCYFACPSELVYTLWGLLIMPVCMYICVITNFNSSPLLFRVKVSHEPLRCGTPMASLKKGFGSH